MRAKLLFVLDEERSPQRRRCRDLSERRFDAERAAPSGALQLGRAIGARRIGLGRSSLGRARVASVGAMAETDEDVTRAIEFVTRKLSGCSA